MGFLKSSPVSVLVNIVLAEEMVSSVSPRICSDSHCITDSRNPICPVPPGHLDHLASISHLGGEEIFCRGASARLEFTHSIQLVDPLPQFRGICEHNHLVRVGLIRHAPHCVPTAWPCHQTRAPLVPRRTA
ncbi:hypothetical protein BC827DRAFT_231410 [Russula dissimulans]|nr:hypothetical protein BC827DRAFT_231410 [Russula dissimulans]